MKIKKDKKQRKEVVMLKYVLGALLVLFCLVPRLSAQEPMQDVVYLKDGSVIRGQIIEQIPNVSITIQIRDGSIFVCKMEDITRITKEPLKEEPPKKVEIKGEKSPVAAFLLSFLVPGLGQAYNEEPLKGLCQLVLYAGGLVTVFIAGTEEVSYIVDTPDYYYYYYETILTPWFWVGLGTATFASLWSMIDAPLSASRINRERGERGWGHLIEFNNDNYALGLGVATKQEGIEAKLTLHF